MSEAEACGNHCLSQVQQSRRTGQTLIWRGGDLGLEDACDEVPVTRS